MRILIDARGLAACVLLPVIAAADVGPSPTPTLSVAGSGPPLAVAAAALRLPPTTQAALTWWPERPVQGRLFVVRLTLPSGGDAGRPAGPMGVEAAAVDVLAARAVAAPEVGAIFAEGEAAGEPLHFVTAADGALESLAAVPIGEEESVEVVVRVVRPGGGTVDSLRVRIPVSAGDYRHERLTVAPRFGRAPDAAEQARLERDRVKASEVSRIAHETPRLWRDPPVMPRASRVTSGFGNGRVFNGQVSSRHMGLDLAGAAGEEVVAAARGVVQLVDEFLLAGNIVYVNHGGGLVSGYFHLSEQLVAEGDIVEAGTPIGRVGATGRVTGPHLHWVVRYGHTSVDPRSLLEVAEPVTATADGAPSAR